MVRTKGERGEERLVESVVGLLVELCEYCRTGIIPGGERPTGGIQESHPTVGVQNIFLSS